MVEYHVVNVVGIRVSEGSFGTREAAECVAVRLQEQDGEPYEVVAVPAAPPA